MADDQDAVAEVETKPAAEAADEAKDEMEDEAKDKMVQPNLKDHLGIVGRMATAPIIALSATTKRKAIWTPQPSPTCSKPTSTDVLGSDV